MKKSKTQADPDDPTFVRARAFTVITTIDSCRQRLVKQASDALASWKEQLSEKTKEYRAIVRDEDNAEASQAAKAKLFDQVVKLVAERDDLKDAKSEDMKGRKAKIAKLDEADAEAKLASKSNEGGQMPLLEDSSRVAGMPWATDATLDVLYTALLDLEQRGATLDEFQSALLSDLAEAEVEGADLGIESEEAIESDEVAEFESEDDEAEVEVPF